MGTTVDPRHRRMTAPRFVNPLVSTILRSPAHAIASRKMLLLSVPGRLTGRIRTFPVGYVEDGGTILVLAGDHETKQWWRNVEAASSVELTVRRRRVAATAEVLRPGSAATADALRRYLRSFPMAAKSLGVPVGPGGPDEAAVGIAARHVVMVRFFIERPSGGGRESNPPGSSSPPQRF